MKLNTYHKQSGSALIGVMVLIVLSMLILPHIMSTTSFAQKRSVDQAVQLKNAAKAEEINHLLHASVATPASNITLLDNYAKHFTNASFTQAACSDVDPCLRRLSTTDVNACPQNRFVKASWNVAGKTISSFSCRNGISPTDANATINCESDTANLSNTADMRIYTCVYDQGTTGTNLAISVWSYMNLADKFLKVQEDSY